MSHEEMQQSKDRQRIRAHQQLLSAGSLVLERDRRLRDFSTAAQDTGMDMRMLMNDAITSRGYLARAMQEHEEFLRARADGRPDVRDNIVYAWDHTPNPQLQTKPLWPQALMLREDGYFDEDYAYILGVLVRVAEAHYGKERAHAFAQAAILSLAMDYFSVELMRRALDGFAEIEAPDLPYPPAIGEVPEA